MIMLEVVEKPTSGVVRWRTVAALPTKAVVFDGRNNDRRPHPRLATPVLTMSVAYFPVLLF